MKFCCHPRYKTLIHFFYGGGGSGEGSNRSNAPYCCISLERVNLKKRFQLVRACALHRAVSLPAHFLSGSHPAARLICLARRSRGSRCFQPGSGLSLPEGHGAHSALSISELCLPLLYSIFRNPSPGAPRSL